MTATYTDDPAAEGGLNDKVASRRESGPGELVAVAPTEITSTPDVPGKWSGSAKLKLILGGSLIFWIAVAATVVWLVG